MLRLGLGLAALIAVLDQLSKLWIIDRFSDYPRMATPLIHVTSFFNLALTWNRGITFGILNNDAAFTGVLFTAVAAVIVFALLLWLRRARHPLVAIAIGLVIGGAIGNVVDRVFRPEHAVVDFLDFHLGGWHWYVFNLADAAICIGVGLLVLDGLIARRQAVT